MARAGSTAKDPSLRGKQGPEQPPAMPKAKTRPRRSRTAPVKPKPEPKLEPVRLALPGGATLQVDAQDAEAIQGRTWRPHRNPETGLTYWAARRPGPEGGEVFLGVFVVAELMGLVVKPGQLVVHLNGDLADARRENLRVAPRGTAMQRREVPKRGGKSESAYLGVNQIIRKGEPTGRWMAKIRLWDEPEKLSRTFYLGTWGSEEEAAGVYDAAARQIHGVSARANFPEA